MRKNFKVGQGDELICGGKVFDLHNKYDVSLLAVEADGDLQLRFVPNSVHGLGGKALALAFTGVDYLEMCLGFGGEPASLDLEEVGYKEPSDRDVSWLQTEDQSDSLDHLFLRFQGEHFLRIHSEEAFLSDLPTGWRWLPDQKEVSRG
ncbi:MAG: hypothetical protein KDD47_12760 [Acidobacteria bacterium]|nr:hypothetical protein [Acidobacteriota bacterium]